MRISQAMTYKSYLDDMMRQQESLFKLHNKLSTSKDINKPSDEPVKLNRLLSSKSALASLEKYQESIDYSLSYLDITENALQSAKEVISEMQQLAVATATETADAGQRSNTAVVVNNLLKELISLGNRSFNDKYIFSGYETGTVPFDATGAYFGDANQQTIKISASSVMEIGVNGGEVFKGTAGGIDIFQTVNDFITALNANDTAGINTALGDLETSFDQLTNAISDIGGQIKRIESEGSEISETKLELQALISGLEDADLTKVISDLKLQQVSLEAAMASSAKVFSINIFDYI